MLIFLPAFLPSDLPTSEGEWKKASLRDGLRAAFENSVNWGTGAWHTLPSVLGLMISNAAKHYGAVKAPLFTGDAAANLPSHVPFVDFCETTTRQRLSPLQTSTTGSFPKAFHPTPY